MAQYWINGQPTTKAKYDMHQFLHFDGPDPNKKKHVQIPKAAPARTTAAASPPLKAAPTQPLPAPRFVEQKSYSKLSEVIAAIRRSGGIASPNRYEVLIHPPWRRRDSSREIEDVSIKCENISLPGRNLNSSPDVTIHGPRREVVNGAAFDDAVDMIFTASRDMRERVFFEKWQYAAFDQNTWNVNFYNDYIGSVDIYLLDNSSPKGRRMYGLKLHECFPKTIGPIPLSYATRDEAIKINVSMNFRYWTSLDIDMATPPAPTVVFPQGF